MSAYLGDAIVAYTREFENEPAHYYPGVNANTLLIEKAESSADENEVAAAQKETERLTLSVSSESRAVEVLHLSDYWDLATVLELAVIGRHEHSATDVAPKVLRAAREGWMGPHHGGQLASYSRSSRTEGRYLQPRAVHRAASQEGSGVAR